LPGAGRALYTFILPLFPHAAPQQLRIMRAACLLHDVSWRAHPDYRHDVCFDNATRANLGGLTHAERVFLGLALLHRYKNSRDNSQHANLFTLLSPEQITAAEILGKAMRFGAMFAIENPSSAGTLKLFPRKHVVQLALSPKGKALLGEVAVARLNSLAASLGARVELKAA
jgi:exopolyphosphatase/guanosine-5'-triphosphate,3'-diphosphate pyrophosphatase